MGKDSVKIIDKKKRKVGGATGGKETTNSVKKSKRNEESAPPPLEQSLRSKSERKLTKKAGQCVENSIQKAFRRVFNKEQRKLDKLGENNNATMANTRSRQDMLQEKSPKAQKDGEVIVEIHHVTQNQKGMVPSDRVKNKRKDNVSSMPKEAEWVIRPVIEHADGIDLSVNDLEDEFKNEVEMYQASMEQKGVDTTSQSYSSSDSDSDETEDGDLHEIDYESNEQVGKQIADAAQLPCNRQDLERQVWSNAEIQQIVKAMVREELQEERRKDSDGNNRPINDRKRRKSDNSNAITANVSTDKSKANNTPKRPLEVGKINQMKSPSDTTLYTPALQRAGSMLDDIVNKISDFVEGVHLEESQK